MQQPAKTVFLIVCLIILDTLLFLDIDKNQKLKIKSQILENTAKNNKLESRRASQSEIDAANEKIALFLSSQTASLSSSLIPNPSKTTEAKKEIVNSSLNILGTQNSAQVKVGEGTSTLLKQINDFRASRGKSAVLENFEICSFATTRANEISTNFNHDGFTNRVNSNSLPYPSYSEVAENIAMNGDANQVVAGWIDSSGHAENLLKDVPYGCVVKNGDHYVFEAWRP